MAQMPIQSMSGRADSYEATRPARHPAAPRGAASPISYVSDASGISGGLLRPGAIDQELFKAYLAAARQEAAAGPPSSPAAPARSAIPTLTPAQLAALGVDVASIPERPPRELVIDIPAPDPVDPGDGAAPRAMSPGVPAGVAGSAGAPLPRAAPAAPVTPTASEPAPADTSPVAADTAPSLPEALDAAPPAAASPAGAARGPVPGSRRGADGVWELPRLPDKDEREMLGGQKWRVVESADSRQLFLGPDGEFGWDDFLDLVNPLQHIPLVNIAYRAITGDEIYGAARMVDAAFGPLAGVSTAIDLAFRDVTGESMASNAIAALFGPGDEAAGEAGTINTASADRTQIASRALFRRGSNK